MDRKRKFRDQNFDDGMSKVWLWPHAIEEKGNQNRLLIKTRNHEVILEESATNKANF